MPRIKITQKFSCHFSENSTIKKKKKRLNFARNSDPCFRKPNINNDENSSFACTYKLFRSFLLHLRSVELLDTDGCTNAKYVYRNIL